MQAIHMAAAQIEAGMGDAFLCVGVESMTMGHPLGATGARLVGKAASLLPVKEVATLWPRSASEAARASPPSWKPSELAAGRTASRHLSSDLDL